MMLQTLNNLKKDYQDKIEIRKKKTWLLSYSRLFSFGLSLLFWILYFCNNFYLIFLILGIVFLVNFVVLVIIHHYVDKYIINLKNKITLIDRYISRYSNEWKKEDYKLDEIKLTNLTTDLDIISSSSCLLKYLDFTCSKGGRDLLIKNLKLEDVNKQDIVLKQDAIKELVENKEFIFDFITSYSSIDNVHNIDYKEYFSLFDKPKKKYHIVFFIISIILSLISIASLVLWIVNVLNYIPFVVMVLIQLIYSYFYSRNYGEEFNTINQSARVYKELKNVYNIDLPSFNSQLNKEFKEYLLKGKNILKYIVKLGDIVTFKYNIVTSILLNVFASLNFVIIFMYQNLLKNKADDFIKSISLLEKEEYLISLTTIPLVKENVTIPLINDSTKLTIKNGYHPLIEETICVGNDFETGKDVNIITGSNMSGKTSFMKMVALNLVLALNGSYVNCQEFNFPIAKIFTSINVKDDITNGISTFYGELSRIKDCIDYLNENPSKLVIVFIDEIFKGTNYQDRIYGAKEVVNKLSSLNVITFLTTHDFELCEINNQLIKNYHFEENYIDDQISFDYKIKNDITHSTNARYLMKKMKIID